MFDFVALLPFVPDVFWLGSALFFLISLAVIVGAHHDAPLKLFLAPQVLALLFFLAALATTAR